MHDELLVSGQFLDEDVLPKNKRWLYRYFDSDIQRHFIRYFLTFGSATRFTDHTGFYISQRWIEKLLKRLKKLEAALVEARAASNFELVAVLESGNFKL